MPDAHQIALLRRAAKIEAYRRDYERFAREQQYIRTKEGTVTRFELRPAQQMIEKVIQDQIKETGWIRLIEFKARQHGGSTHGVSRATHRVFLTANISALILAQDDSTASNLFNMAQLMYEAMDPDIRPVRRYLTKQEIVLENPDPKTRPELPGLRSNLAIQSAKNVHAGVGTTRNWVHISEMCRFGNTQELMGSLLPAIPLAPGTAIINESAPYGFGQGRDAFKAACDAARADKSPFKFVGIYWWMIPEYQLPLSRGEVLRLTADEKSLRNAIKRVSKKELGEEFILTDEQLKYRRIMVQTLGQGDDAIGEQLFLQQFPYDYESGWVTMDLAAFNRYKLEKLAAATVRAPMRRCEIENGEIIDSSKDAPFWIWENPQPGEAYDIGVDPSPGIPGGSLSCFQVVKRSNNEQVAEFQGCIKPFDFAPMVTTAGMYYNAAHVGSEIEGVGYAVDEALKQLGYPNLYQWRHRNHVVPKLSGYSGWKTQMDSKHLLVTVTNHYLEHDELIIRSVRLMAELRRFQRFVTEVGNEIYDVSEGNSDLAMSYMITLTIARDEKMLELPMEGSANERTGAPTTLAERNKRLQDALERTQGMIDDPEREGFAEQRSKDPWDVLAEAMKGGDTFH